MRHVTLIIALVLTFALGSGPGTAADQTADPASRILHSAPGWGPYADPNG